MTEIGVEMEIDKVKRFGSFDKERKNRRNAIITMSNDWDVRMLPAKSAQIRIGRKKW